MNVVSAFALNLVLETLSFIGVEKSFPEECDIYREDE
jgi:hypothetical protein